MTCLLIDVFCGPSHEHLIKFVRRLNQGDDDVERVKIVTFPAKKWPWMARTGALQCLAKLPSDLSSFRSLIVTSTLNLAELVALRPQIQNLKKILYFHENQLVYPVQKTDSGDFQFGYNEIISALCADQVLFNSLHNFSSFLEAIPSFLGRIPGMTATSSAVSDIVSNIRAKSDVLYLPLDYIGMNTKALPLSVNDGASSESDSSSDVCRILWSHRMEHDKDPLTFFRVLQQLMEDSKEDGKTVNFKLIVLGQGFSELPPEVESARQALGDAIEFWGFLPDRQDYYAWLRRCDIVVSTAKHEFFGLSMLEATYLGCYPLAPQRLSYPELLPAECLYRTEAQLRKLLAQLCRSGKARVNTKRQSLAIDWNRLNWESNLSAKYASLLQIS